MRCHFCDAEAVYAPRSGDVRVGLCERHLREGIAAFPEEAVQNRLRQAMRD